MLILDLGEIDGETLEISAFLPLVVLRVVLEVDVLFLLNWNEIYC